MPVTHPSSRLRRSADPVSGRPGTQPGRPGPIPFGRIPSDPIPVRPIPFGRIPSDRIPVRRFGHLA